MSLHPYIAHLSKDGRKQTVSEHLQGTAEKCSGFAADFGGGNAGKACRADPRRGKCTDGFQRRLLENGPKVDHSTAGAFECMKRGQLFVAFAVAGHHGGLPDGGGGATGRKQARFSAA